MSKSWSATDDATLRRDVMAGLGNRVLADRYGRSVDSIKHRASRLGLPRQAPRPRAKVSKWTEARDAKLRELAATGFTDAQIAERMDDREQAIRYRRQQLRVRIAPVKVEAHVTYRERQRRMTNVITRIESFVPVGLVLGDVIGIGDRDLRVIAYNPDNELVCVDEETKEVVLVGER